jgi:hypothetical protein
MATRPVVFVVPIVNFNTDKRPPPDGENTTENIVVTGPDYTRIIIPAGVKYNSNASTNYQSTFTGSDDGSKQFTIEFPQNTIHNTQTSGKYTDIFITPAKIYYSLENTFSIQKNPSSTTVVVNIGSIDITTPQSKKTSVSNNPDYTPESLDKMVKDKIQDAGKEVGDNIEKVIYENFNKNFLTLIYTLLKDFLVVIIIWLVLLNIGVWGTVDANLVHPIDVTKYPYTYNDGQSINNLTSFLPTESGVFCGKLDANEISKISTQLRDQLQKNPETKEKLSTINPVMSEISQKNIYYISKLIQSSCSSTGSYSNALSVFIYWLSYLIFTQGVYQNYVLHGFHKILNTVVGTITKTLSSENYASSIILAVVIYGIIIASQPTIGALKKLFKQDIPDKFIEKPENVFLYGCISAFSIILIIAIPLFFILFTIGLLGHIQSILRIIFESNSVECAFLSIIALTTTVITFFQVITFMIDRGTGIITITTIQEQIMKYLNFSSIFTIISNGAGVCIPLALALMSAFVISFRILLTSSYLMKKKIDVLINLTPAVMILLFYFLLQNVKTILGTAQAVITLGVISFFGFYFISKK